MPRFERADDSSFWEIERDGATLITRFGRIGTVGLRSTKQLEGEAEAIEQYDRQIAQRQRNGYRLLVADAEAAQAPALPAAAARDPALEAAIRAAPSDRAQKLVYADWLTERGDPRGELIALYHAFETEPGQQALIDRKRAVDQRAEALTAWLWQGLLPHEAQVDLRWQTGFITSAKLHGKPAPLAEVLECLLVLPSAIALEKLRLQPGGHERLTDAFARLARHAPPLRALDVHDLRGEALAPLYPALPELRKLELHGVADLGALALPKLRSLTLSGGTTPGMIEAVAAAELPALADLSLTYGDHTSHDLAPLIATTHLPALRILSIPTTEGTLELLQRMATAPLTRQLEHLDFLFGDLDDDDLEPLTAVLPQFGHLRRLSLGRELSAAACKRLASWPFVSVVPHDDRYEGSME